LSASGEFGGIEPQIAKTIFEKLGVPKLSGTPVAFDALIPGLQANRFDMIAAGMYIKPDRCKVVLFSKPLVCSGEGLLVKKGNPLGLSTYESIVAKGARFSGVSSGLEFNRAIAAGVSEDKAMGTTDILNSIELLRDGRVDVVGFPQLSLIQAMEKLGTTDLELIAPVQGEPIGCSGAVFRVEDRDVRDAYDTELDRMSKSGELAKIMDQYKLDAKLSETQSREAFCKGPN
jgi:polar amino acid transport system substrate-binding protein